MAKVPLATNGFYLEAHPKLRPFDFSTDGIYLCGTAHSPQSLDEVIAQSQAAASHALVTISRDIVVNEPIIAVVDEDKCIGCGNCEPVCPYNAVKIEKRVPSEAHGVKGVSEIDPLLCKGCGSCVVECPEKAITMQYFRDEQLSEMIDSSLTPPPKPGQIRILAFLCNWCAYAGADTAGVSRFKYPTNLRVMRVMCSGRVDELHILEAFNKGFDGVLVAGCHPSDCHYISGNDNAKRRIERLKKLLEKAGFESDRLRLEWISAGEGKRFADTVKELTEAITAMGQSPLRKGPPESSKRKRVVRAKVTSK
jgi:heterodisulfide reductase subunit A